MTNTQSPAPGVAAEPVMHLRQYGDVTSAQMEQYLQTGTIAGQPDKLEEVIDAYLESYELNDGESRTHTPNEFEAFLIKDAIMGLLADPGWDAEWGKHISSIASRTAPPLPAQVQEAEDPAETLAMVCDVFGIGSAARTRSTILANVENAKRRADCLWAVEHAYFVVTEPDEDDPDGEPIEIELLNWGDDPDQYVKRFGEVLASRTPASGMDKLVSKIWLDDMADDAEPIEITVFGDEKNLKRLQAYLENPRFKAAPGMAGGVGVGGEDLMKGALTKTQRYTAYKLAIREINALVKENFGRTPQDKWTDEVIDLAGASEAGQWFCEDHPEKVMGHGGCTGAGIPECAQVSVLANQLRLSRQETREANRMRDETALAAKRCAAPHPSPAQQAAGAMPIPYITYDSGKPELWMGYMDAEGCYVPVAGPDPVPASWLAAVASTATGRAGS